MDPEEPPGPGWVDWSIFRTLEVVAQWEDTPMSPGLTINSALPLAAF